MENTKRQLKRKEQDLQSDFSRKSLEFIVFNVFFSWDSRFRSNGHGNLQTIYRSNRFSTRNTNMETISSITYYTERIDWNKKTLRNFNHGLLTQFSTKIQTTNWYMIYELCTTQSLTQLRRLRILEIQPFLTTATESRGSGLDDAKQPQQVNSGGAWNDSCSSTMPYPSGIFSCHGARTCFNGEEPSRIFYLLASKTCKQSFNSKHNWWIRQGFLQRLKNYGWDFWKKVWKFKVKSERMIQNFLEIFCCEWWIVINVHFC